MSEEEADNLEELEQAREQELETGVLAEEEAQARVEEQTAAQAEAEEEATAEAEEENAAAEVQLAAAEEEYAAAEAVAAEVAAESPTGPRISSIEGFFAVLFALAIDIAQIVLDAILIGFVLNFIIDVAAWLTFYIWFKSKGIDFGFSNVSRIRPQPENFSLFKNPIIIITITFLIEYLPIINALPGWTIGVFLTILFEYQSYWAAKTGTAKTA